jgi:RsmE family RNA methyltransferase
MGIKKIHLVNAWRVEKSFWSSPALAPDDVREQLLLGLEQGGDTVLPEVTQHRLFRPFVEDDLPALTRDTLALAAHPRAGDDCPRNVAGPVTLAIGPEGGLTDYELDMLQAAGFRPVRLGARVLRVEHALPALVGRLF